MKIPYKNRIINLDEPVEVYRNLNKSGKWYSIRQFGKIVAHSDDVMLKNCQFIVRKSGYHRYLKKKEKNVHAWIKGVITDNEMGTTVQECSRGLKIKYDLETGEFIDQYTKNPINSAMVVVLNNCGEFTYYTNT